MEEMKLYECIRCGDMKTDDNEMCEECMIKEEHESIYDMIRNKNKMRRKREKGQENGI